MKSINALYRWNMLTIERLNLLSLRSRSSGVEQAMYRALLQSCTEEMEQLTPLLVEIFKHIKKYSVMQDIIAIYFEDQRYANVKIGLNQKSPFSKGRWFSPIIIFRGESG